MKGKMEVEYVKKVEDMRKYIPFLEHLIKNLKDGDEQQLNKMQILHTVLTENNKRIRLEALIRCEDILLKVKEVYKQKGLLKGLGLDDNDTEPPEKKKKSENLNGSKFAGSNENLTENKTDISSSLLCIPKSEPVSELYENHSQISSTILRKPKSEPVSEQYENNTITTSSLLFEPKIEPVLNENEDHTDSIITCNPVDIVELSSDEEHEVSPEDEFEDVKKNGSSQFDLKIENVFTFSSFLNSSKQGKRNSTEIESKNDIINKRKPSSMPGTSSSSNILLTKTDKSIVKYSSQLPKTENNKALVRQPNRVSNDTKNIIVHDKSGIQNQNEISKEWLETFLVKLLKLPENNTTNILEWFEKELDTSENQHILQKIQNAEEDNLDQLRVEILQILSQANDRHIFEKISTDDRFNVVFDVAGKPSRKPFSGKNIFRQFHCRSKYLTYCLICTDAHQFVVAHYVNKHRDKEVYVSRLPQSDADHLKANPNLGYTGQRKSSLLRYTSVCVFCKKEMSHPSRYWFEHYTMHTGEYTYQCSVCSTRKARRNQFRVHWNKECPGTNTEVDIINLHRIDTRSTRLRAYLCADCNFIQLHISNMQKHLRTQHNISKINDTHYHIVVLLDVKPW